jgi:hypothetical protein
MLAERKELCADKDEQIKQVVEQMLVLKSQVTRSTEREEETAQQLEAAREQMKCLEAQRDKALLASKNREVMTVDFLGYTPLLGLHSLTWITLPYLDYTPLLGLHSLTWITLPYLDYTPLLGLHSLTWITLPYLGSVSRSTSHMTQHMMTSTF